jgi:hypothetical protein
LGDEAEDVGYKRGVVKSIFEVIIPKSDVYLI